MNFPTAVNVFKAVLRGMGQWAVRVNIWIENILWQFHPIQSGFKAILFAFFTVQVFYFPRTQIFFREMTVAKFRIHVTVRSIEERVFVD